LIRIELTPQRGVREDEGLCGEKTIILWGKNASSLKSGERSIQGGINRGEKKWSATPKKIASKLQRISKGQVF